jgi:hypothetical protein
MALTKPFRKESIVDLNLLKSENSGNYLPTKRTIHNTSVFEPSQDDENLIRETQAALKSLSGGLANARNYGHKLNEQYENVCFQNLFDSNRCIKSHDPSTLVDGQYNFESVRIKKENVDDIASSPEQCSAFNKHQYKTSLDFNELVNDSSNEDDGHCVKKSLKRKSPFSQQSAFKPISVDCKKGSFSNYSAYGSQPHAASNYQSSANFYNHQQQQAASAAPLKDESFSKSMDSPDSKQYTILQPAGIGSRAASVMKDIAREGVVSVSAVSSTSSPGLDQNKVTSTTTTTTANGIANNLCEKLFDSKYSPQFSPGKGNLRWLVKEKLNKYYNHITSQSQASVLRPVVWAKGM